MTYSASAAKATQGTVLKISDGASPEVFTTVGEVREVPDFGNEKPLVDVTNLQSSAREYIGGLQDGASISFPLNIVRTDSGQAAVRTAHAAGVPVHFIVSYPDGYSDSFMAVVTKFSTMAALNDAIKGTISLKLTSLINTYQG